MSTLALAILIVVCLSIGATIGIAVATIIQINKGEDGIRHRGGDYLPVDLIRDWMDGHVRVPVELIKFIEAKEHHLPIEDRHALSVMLNASKGEL